MSLIDDILPDLDGLTEDEIRERIEAHLEDWARRMAGTMVPIFFGELPEKQRAEIAHIAMALQGALRQEYAAMKAAQLVRERG